MARNVNTDIAAAVTDTTNSQALGGITATAMAAPNSQIAGSLFSANWEQLITLSFHIQLGDIIGLVGVLLALDAFFSRRRRK